MSMMMFNERQGGLAAPMIVDDISSLRINSAISNNVVGPMGNEEEDNQSFLNSTHGGFNNLYNVGAAGIASKSLEESKVAATTHLNQLEQLNSRYPNH